MQGGGEMPDSGGAQSSLLPEPGPLVLTWVMGKPRAPELSCVQDLWRVLNDSDSSLVGGRVGLPCGTQRHEIPGCVSSLVPCGDLGFLGGTLRAGHRAEPRSKGGGPAVPSLPTRPELGCVEWSCRKPSTH